MATQRDKTADLFLDLCKAGKLYEVESWIESGRPLPRFFGKTTPLEAALKAGFHSLVELLVRHETDQQEKNKALAVAVATRRLDLVELVVEYGAEIQSVPLSDVLHEWEPSVTRFFIGKGADLVEGAPFAEAFGSRIRTALGPFMDCKTMYPELSEQLLEQADKALRYHCEQGNLKWVSILLWAGASPRKSGPTLWDDYEDDPASHKTPLQIACCSGHLEIVKKLRPDPAQDDLTQLLGEASFFAQVDVIRYLLALGAEPNDKPNGGSSALDRCIWHFQFENFDPFRDSRTPIPAHRVPRTKASIRELVEHGATWKPDERDRMNEARRILFKMESDSVFELVKLFVKHGSCTQETLLDLLRTARMKQHLAGYEKQLVEHFLLVTPARKRFFSKKPKQNAGSSRDRREPARPSYYLTTRYNREQLYEEVWSEPMQKLAKKYGISDVGLAKVCRKLNLPRPGRGYWAKKVAGKRVKRRPRLPALKD